ncbi:unnamed protein product, partial [Ectocarpus fasciculatus]
AGLWNLALCYERGVGVARDPLAAQALQQQCKDREASRRRSSVPGDQAGPLAPHLRRSSDSSASVVPPPTADNDNSKANDSESKVNARRRSSRRRSSSVPLVTPPPPEGAPPPTATRGNPAVNSQGISPESTTVTSRRSSSSSKQPYKYVPKRDGPLPTDIAGRPNTSSNRQAAAGGQSGRNNQHVREGVADDTASPTGERTGGTSSAPWIPPPPRDRKNSLLLKPTPQAIARVKAAVERRKKLQAAAAPSAQAADARNPDGLPTAPER